MHPGRFVGFYWNVVNPMTFKVLQYNTDPYKCNMVIHIGVDFPRTLTAVGYDSSLEPSSDNYFPDIQL